MSGVKVLISSALILIILKVVSANVQVKTSGGVVEGIEVKSILKDEKYYSFFGIPYGEPPVGSLRFMVRIFYELTCSEYRFHLRTSS